MKIALLLIVLFISLFSYSQQVKGSFKFVPDKKIKLLGYDNFQTIDLGETQTDDLGGFTFDFSPKYKGMAYLETSDKSRLFIVLTETNVNISGEYLNNPVSITFKNSAENEIFNQYAIEHNQRESALAGWNYLLPIYRNSDILEDSNIVNSILSEINKIESQDSIFLADIDKSLYMSWYLPMRKLIDDMPLATTRYPNEIPELIVKFREIDFNNPRFKTSGILDDVIEGHFLMLENMGQPLDSAYNQMNISIDYIISNLRDNTLLLNEVSDYIFELLEKRSLFQSSEYLALKLLTDTDLTIDKDLTDKLELYRRMKIGNISADIDFTQGSLNRSENKIESLVDIKGEYKLIIFGSGSCNQCRNEVNKLKSFYSSWTQKGISIIFISLETDISLYNNYSKSLPWLSYCDFAGWESKPAKDYHVFGTPTYFLIDNQRKILLRPNSAEHINAWVNYMLK